MELQIWISWVKWSQHMRFKNDLICGFCPLAMPLAASQLISIDLFSSGQQNGFDLASPCNGLFTFVGRLWMNCLTFHSCWSGVPVWFQFNKTGSILSIDFSLSSKLMLYSFHPANQRECTWIILLWVTHLQQGCKERCGSLVNWWALPEIQCTPPCAYLFLKEPFDVRQFFLRRDFPTALT